MAFRRLSTDLPKDPVYPADLKELGFKQTDDGHFVNIETGEYFAYRHTNNDRANEVRREAMTQCIRSAVFEALKEFDIKPLYCHGDTYSETADGPAVPILTTSRQSLKAKREVVMLVGEYNHDLGIFAYRLLMNEGGMEEGSVIGLLKQLQTLARPPGVIIFNPGQLLYSHKEKQAMSQTSWLARNKESALHEHYRIHPVHNYVTGHTTPNEHVATVLKYVVPEITHEGAKLYTIAISDGCENMLKAIDVQLEEDSDAWIGGAVEAFALMQTTHRPHEIKNAALRMFLNLRGRGWVTALDVPPGKLIALPDEEEVQNAVRAVDGKAGSTSPSRDKQKPRIDRRGSVSATSPPIAIPGTSGADDDASTDDETVKRIAEQRGKDNDLITKHTRGSLLYRLRKINIVPCTTPEFAKSEYAEVGVNCPTISSDADLIELVFPAARDEVMKFFRAVRDSG